MAIPPIILKKGVGKYNIKSISSSQISTLGHFMLNGRISFSKRIPAFYFFILMLILSPQTVASPDELLPYAELSGTELGQKLILIEAIIKQDPKLALAQLTQLKSSNKWQHKPIFNAKYYIIKFHIHRALSSPTDANIVIKEMATYAINNKLNWLTLEAKYYQANIILMQNGNNIAILNIIETALPLAIKINFSHLVGRFYNLRAISLQNSGNNEAALIDYHQAIDILSHYPNESWLIKIYSNISIVYLELEDLSKGLEFNQLAFDIYEKEAKDDAELKTSLLIMKAVFFKRLHADKKAITTLYLAKESAEKSGSINLILNVKNNLSGMLLKNKKVNDAKEIAQECIELSIEHNIISSLYYCRSNLGQIEMELGNYPAAIELLSQAKEGFKQQNSIKAMIEQQRSLSHVYERSGDFYNALKLHKEYYQSNIELMFNERTSEILKLQESYEAKLKEKQITLLSTKNDLQTVKIKQKELNNRLLALASSIVFVLLIFFIRRYILVNKQKMVLEKSNTKLFNTSLIDPLTKIANRRALNEHIKKFDNEDYKTEIHHCITIIDIDHFKQVNDTYGHSVGDEVIVIIVDRLKTQIRQNDMLARWGGEEFILLIENPENTDGYLIINRIIKTISSTPVKTSVGNLHITISAGATSVSADKVNSDLWPKLLHSIDIALYKAKESGRNQVQMTSL